MLSLVLLTGYAGQVSLAQLAFAGIAAAAVWKLGPVLGLVGGVVDRGGGRRARRPARAQDADLYLALRRWRSPCSSRRTSTATTRCSTSAAVLARATPTADRIPGLEGDTAFFMSMAVAFALVALLLTVIRNGPFGRRLQAMKDSPGGLRHPRPRPHRHQAPGVRAGGRHRRPRRRAARHVEVVERRPAATSPC